MLNIAAAPLVVTGRPARPAAVGGVEQGGGEGTSVKTPAADDRPAVLLRQCPGVWHGVADQNMRKSLDIRLTCRHLDKRG